MLQKRKSHQVRSPRKPTTVGLTPLELRELLSAVGTSIAAGLPLISPNEPPVEIGQAIAGGAQADRAHEGAMAYESRLDTTHDSLVRATLPAPTITSIGGYTSSAAGITNGLVDMSVGTRWNGYRAVNDRAETYYWTISGNNFGAARGSVRLANRTVPIQSWSNRQIRIMPSGSQINPSQPWNWGPMSTTLEVRTADSRVGTHGVSIVPAIRTRIFEQCTWHVAKRRIEMGLQPSPTAYGNYSSITASWVPRTGDQLKWGGSAASGGSHQAIIESASRTTTPDGRTVFNFRISQYNASGNNEYSTFNTIFEVRNGIVIALPRFRFDGSGATGYYR